MIKEYEVKNELIMDKNDIDRLKRYQTAWQFPKEKISWTAYVFYGADVKYGFEKYIREQIELISSIDDDCEGFFICSDEEDANDEEWRIKNGKLSIIRNEFNLE